MLMKRRESSGSHQEGIIRANRSTGFKEFARLTWPFNAPPGGQSARLGINPKTLDLNSPLIATNRADLKYYSVICREDTDRLFEFSFLFC